MSSSPEECIRLSEVLHLTGSGVSEEQSWTLCYQISVCFQTLRLLENICLISDPKYVFLCPKSLEISRLTFTYG